MYQEAQIEEYFKPIDKEAEMIMKTQLEGEERTMKEMMKAMHQQALLEKTEAEKEAQKKLETDQKNQESRPKTQDPASAAAPLKLRWDDFVVQI